MNRNIFLIIGLLLFLVACGTSNPLPLVEEVVEETEENIQDNDIRSVTFNTSEGEETITYEVIDDLAILEGDIILGTAEELENLHLNPQGVFHDKECGWLWCTWTNNKDYRWPNGVVPYVVDSSVTMSGQQNIQDAMTEWETKTSIRFVVKQSRHKDYVKFVKGSSKRACFSAVGRQRGMQKIRLNSSGDCSKGSLIHEIGHAIGLWHEQSRQDRNSHVEIVWDNIPKKWRYAFEKNVRDGLDVGPYDYTSIMHYGPYAFCKKDSADNCVGPTIKRIDNGPIGRTNSLSIGDIDAITWLYPRRWMISHSSVDGSLPLQPFNSTTFEQPFALGDFNGDGKDDVFITYTQQSKWFVFYGGASNWEVLNNSGVSLESLRLGDFNGDGKTDVFRAHPRQRKWYVSYGGTGGWEVLNNSGIGSDNLRFGDFDGDGKTDVFRTTSGVWYISSGGSSGWEVLGSSSIALKDIAFGDFDGDGKTDVFKTENGRWYMSSGGKGRWKRLVTSSYNLSELKFADFNGDGKTDVFRTVGKKWYVSYIGTSGWKQINSEHYTKVPPYTKATGLAFGDFNGDGKDDIFTTLERSSNY